VVEAEETAAARTASAAPRRRRRAMVFRSVSPASGGGGSSEGKRERKGLCGFLLVLGRNGEHKAANHGLVGCASTGPHAAVFCLGLQQSQRPTTQKKNGKEEKKPNQLFM
jgi:hypothetical protein